MRPNKRRIESQGTSQSSASKKRRTSRSKDEDSESQDDSGNMAFVIQPLIFHLVSFFDHVNDFSGFIQDFALSALRWSCKMNISRSGLRLPKALSNRSASSTCWILVRNGKRVLQTKILNQARCDLLPALEQHTAQLVSLLPHDNLAQTWNPSPKMLHDTFFLIKSDVESLINLLDIGFRLKHDRQTKQNYASNSEQSNIYEFVTMRRLLDFCFRIPQVFQSLLTLIARIDDLPCPLSRNVSGTTNENSSTETEPVATSVREEFGTKACLEIRELIDWFHQPEYSDYHFRSNQIADHIHEYIGRFQTVIDHSLQFAHDWRVQNDVAPDDCCITRLDIIREESQPRPPDTIFVTNEAIDCTKALIPVLKLSRLIVDRFLPSRIQKQVRRHLSSVEFFSRLKPLTQPIPQYCRYLEFLCTLDDAMFYFSFQATSGFEEKILPDKQRRYCNYYFHQEELLDDIRRLKHHANMTLMTFNNFYNTVIQDASQDFKDLIHQDREWIEAWAAEFELGTSTLASMLSEANDWW
ncbi:hypothetical protein O181_036382 [Austropuccinia psidii MF-1]|uniref:Uncharacterized protein n=1 Tax=Austropuccinia psidii MF-1 TaxID=1389203 RepID=A0A9Q3DAM4_9BASI|nr:hypothetical protein [Austropuccinia psidii MF-1]